MFLSKAFVFCVFAFISSPTLAKKEADDSFSQGLSAARTGDYEDAIEYFRQARRLGKKSDALLYNLGVCFYKLNDYESAIFWFELLLRSEKSRGLALYNLGLANAKIGQDVKALRWFKRVLSSDADNKLKSLTAKQIKKLYAAKKAEVSEHRQQKLTTSNKRVQGGANIDFGWDDNIIYPESNMSTNEGDAFGKYFAWAKFRALGNGHLGLNIRTLGYGTRYQNADDYNRQMLHLDLSPYWRWNKWTYEFELAQEFSYLGDESYLSANKYSISARKYIKRGSSALLKYGFEDYKDESPGFYPFLEGDRQYLSFKYYSTHGSFRYKLSYDVEKNDRNDLEVNPYFFSYSPFRQNLSLLWEQTWVSRITTRQGISYRYSQFQDENVFLDNGDEEIRQRDDDRVSLQLGVGFIMNRHVSLNLDYLFSQNSSSIPYYKYEQNILSVGLHLKM